jgi:glycosyltransferase involved in cell wall biosynthesis
MRFSIVLCTYNGEAFLREQLESLVGQSRAAVEVVVCDDASTDRTIEILRAYEDRLPIRLETNESTLGFTRNFQKAIAEARGDLIVLCDQDDVWEPHKLERIEAAFGAPRVGLAFSDAELIDERGERIGRRLWETIGFCGSLLKDFDEDPLRVLGRAKNVVTGATMAFRSQLRELVLPIPDIWSHDAWIAAIVAFAASLVRIPRPLIRYRIHAHQKLGLKPAMSTPVRQPEALRLQSRQFEAVIERVRTFANPQRLHWVEEMVMHVEARARLPAVRTARILPILSELKARRYHRYSNGLRSAIKDLFSQ